MRLVLIIVIAFLAFSPGRLDAQHEHHEHMEASPLTAVDPQPLLAQAGRLQEALEFLGSSLSQDDKRRLEALRQQPLSATIARSIQEILDPYCIAFVNINPETRVKVERGPAAARLVQAGWVSFLVKVVNEAGVTARLEAESPNAAPPLFVSTFSARTAKKNELTPGQVADRFLELQMYRNRPLLPNLSGLGLEYAVLQVFCRDAGKREAALGFNIGQGTQDIGFRNAVSILFESKPSVQVNLHIYDEDGSPAMASLIISDGVERILDDSANAIDHTDFRLIAAQREYRAFDNNGDQYKPSKLLTGIYPLPSRRVAAHDEYPDFFFEPQVYRADGEHVQLPAGKYTVQYTRGPEYVPQQQELVVPTDKSSIDAEFRLKRWIHLAALGWRSADHHVHAAGCSHYESPEEGVRPGDMWRQALGEDLNVSALLAWGPGWYHQKQFFTGRDNPLSTGKNILRNDVEVSGFPSSHAGHIVLLRLKEDDYPGTRVIEDWPSWTAPVLSWAKAQGGATGYAHSGWGLEPLTPTRELPNYVLPRMDGIGANEYVVTVTQGLVDFFSAGDTPAPWELNMWYHTLNCGFTPRLSGETDFPCIFDERVGLARSYFKTDHDLSYDGYVDAIRKGRSYVSDGRSHIIDFSVNGLEAGRQDSKLSLAAGKKIRVNARVAANLPLKQDEQGAAIAASDPAKQPYWHLERARIGQSRKVPVELLINGKPVDTTEITADGNWNDVAFEYPVTRSCWAAVRIYPSSHSNPVFIIVDGKPIREPASAEWCRKAVDQCWKMKQENIRPAERAAAQKEYDKARSIYDAMRKGRVQ